MKNMNTNTTTYAVIVMDTWTVIKDGFKTWEGAYNWMLAHDQGQYELDGGLYVIKR